MNRINFLKSAGVAAFALAIPKREITAAEDKPDVVADACTLIPSETAGPFPLDLTTNQFYYRRDVREDRTGTLLRQRMRIVGADDCMPMQNVRVNIWHCDKDGNYSGYGTEEGKTYLRGYQITNADGEVEFETIFPGWYPGRICHIHFQVFVSSVYQAVSQLTYPLDTRNEVYAENPDEYVKGADPLSYKQDGVFADGYILQLATLTKSEMSDEYTSMIEVPVRGAGTTGVGYFEKETAKNLRLGQNTPNPAQNETVIPFTLYSPSEVRLELFDLNGRKVATVFDGRLEIGEYSMPVNRMDVGLFHGALAYQISVRNSNGSYSDVKLITWL